MALVVLLAAPSIAGAVEFHDQATGVRFAYDFPDARVCVLKPSGMGDAQGCAGLAVDKARGGAMDLRAIFAAIVRRSASKWVMTVLATPRPDGPWTATNSNSLAKGVVDSFVFHLGSAELAGPVVNASVHGQPALHFVVTWTSAKLPADTAWTGVVVGGERLAMLQLMGPRVDLPALQEAGLALLASVSVPGEPTGLAAAGAYQKGRRIGRLIALAMTASLALVVAFGVYLAIRRRRRRRSATP